MIYPQEAEKPSFADAVAAEVQRARSLHGDYNSLHEGYAVLMEKVEEFWEEVRKKSAKRKLADAYKELTHVAAVAQRIAEGVIDKGNLR